jgi:MFS family permease
MIPAARVSPHRYTVGGARATSFRVRDAGARLSLGRLADTWGRRRLLAIGVTVWAGLTGMGGLAARYGLPQANRRGVGIGEANLLTLIL